MLFVSGAAEYWRRSGRGMYTLYFSILPRGSPHETDHHLRGRWVRLLQVPEIPFSIPTKGKPGCLLVGPGWVQIWTWDFTIIPRFHVWLHGLQYLVYNCLYLLGTLKQSSAPIIFWVCKIPRRDSDHRPNLILSIASSPPQTNSPFHIMADTPTYIISPTTMSSSPVAASYVRAH
jgi:hypothetical protein